MALECKSKSWAMDTNPCARTHRAKWKLGDDESQVELRKNQCQERRKNQGLEGLHIDCIAERFEETMEQASKSSCKDGGSRGRKREGGAAGRIWIKCRWRVISYTRLHRSR